MIKYYKHPITEKIKKVKIGFSFTTCFFGPLPALFRGDFKFAAISFGFVILISLLMTLIGLEKQFEIVSIVSWCIWAEYYNGIYEKELIKKGYKHVE